jgi:hypothetical protein
VAEVCCGDELWEMDSTKRYVKDAFHRYVINGERDAVNPEKMRTKASALYQLQVPAAGEVSVRLRLSAAQEASTKRFGRNFDQVFAKRAREGDGFYAGGFLGLDNIGIFDRSRPPPTRGYLQQADGTAWMGFYCANLFSIALDLAQAHSSYEDIAYKFFESSFRPA